MFTWLRSAVRNAVLAGVNDALTELAPDGQEINPDVLQALQARLRPALPAPGPAEEEAAVSKPGRRKAATT